MATLSKEKFLKLNGQLQNGWRMDAQYYVFHGEYSIYQRVKLTDKKFLQFDISFSDHCINPEEKCGYLRKYEGYDIKVRKSEWDMSDSGCASSHGFGIRKMLVENAGKKKAFKLLAEVSKGLTVEQVRELYDGTELNPLGLCAGYSRLAV